MPKAEKQPKSYVGTAEKVHSFSRQVFTSRLEESDSIGWLCGYANTKRYDVQWMSPKRYLEQVDRYFYRHADEESLPWLLDKMVALTKGVGDKKFAPLMMNPRNKRTIVEGYELCAHEGRHRALAASFLKIPEIPVAIEIDPYFYARTNSRSLQPLV